MGKEDFDNYLAKRFEPQVAWYDRKATRYKNYYHWLQWTIVITSAIVPPMIVWMPEDYKLVTVIPSIALTIATSSQKVFKFQEHWINYRAIAEALKKEKHFYDAGANGYASADDKKQLFVERTEAIMSRENMSWVDLQTKTEHSNEGKGTPIEKGQN